MNIFVTATNTDVGKTYGGLKLLEEFASRGYRVGVFKPIETGVEEYPKDGKLLLEKAQSLNSDFDFSLNEIVPYQFKLPAAPFVAKRGETIDKRALYTTMKKLQSRCDVLIIEGAGGLMVPIELDFYMIDLIKLFDAKALLVTSSKLGSINDTLLSLKALDDSQIEYTWGVNLYQDLESFESVTAPYYTAKFKKYHIINNDISSIADFFV